MANATIYHNPACSTSRKVLALLRERGVAAEVVEYLKTPPDGATLDRLLKGLAMRPSQLLRRKGGLVREFGLDGEGVSEDAIRAAMLANPVLIERPIVVTAMGVRLGRPPERVLEILG